MLDKDKLKKIANDLNLKITFGSETPGISSVVGGTKKTTPFSDLLSFFDEPIINKSILDEDRNFLTHNISDYSMTLEIEASKQYRMGSFKVIQGKKVSENSMDDYQNINLDMYTPSNSTDNEAA